MGYSIEQYNKTIKKISSIIEQSNDYNFLLGQICTEVSTEYNVKISVLDDKFTYFDNNDNSNNNSVEKTLDNKNKSCLTLKLVYSNNKYVLVDFWNKSGVCELNAIFISFMEIVLKMIIKNIKLTEKEQEKKQRQEVKNVLDKLTFSELTAIIRVFEEFEKSKGTIVASKIAQKHDLTRSSIVNGIRKLESAMVIESYSLGVKGTHIKIINNYFKEEINKLK